jgi:hypothetical protein
MKETVKRKSDWKVFKYLDGKKVMRVVDNGNGFTVKAYSWSSVNADQYWNIGYADAADLVDCLKKMEYR